MSHRGVIAILLSVVLSGCGGPYYISDSDTGGAGYGRYDEASKPVHRNGGERPRVGPPVEGPPEEEDLAIEPT
ncbi:hypothetical protein Q9295_11270 [Xinfangfangia sp. CPCC 101601]|uniref:Argininosuccinate lyase n=1 Tax=Pseudogemmobacter lacusdianii TaxID=3069608 RepID=A0ABU0VYX6_9RHOB|nr:hypothetical protein [Xinfangfangia sp. CPCC 101601]MDQ2066957.1 hypothetical protein [Xinfangfangia sp. CPCC 101601]